MKYKTKSVEVEVVPVREAVNDATNNWRLLPDWLRIVYDGNRMIFKPDGIIITTEGAEKVGYLDDMIVRGLGGKIDIWPIELFEQTFEKVPIQTSCF